jgi:hypothetical protein
MINAFVSFSFTLRKYMVQNAKKRYFLLKNQDYLKNHPASYLKVSGVPLLEIKQPECEAGKSLPFSDKVNDDWCQSPVSLYALVCRDSCTCFI